MLGWRVGVRRTSRAVRGLLSNDSISPATRPSVARAGIVDFTSCQAQRMACEAYIGHCHAAAWRALPARFDDEGVGGTTRAARKVRGDPALWTVRGTAGQAGRRQRRPNASAGSFPPSSRPKPSIWSTRAAIVSTKSGKVEEAFPIVSGEDVLREQEDHEGNLIPKVDEHVRLANERLAGGRDEPMLVARSRGAPGASLRVGSLESTLTSRRFQVRRAGVVPIDVDASGWAGEPIGLGPTCTVRAAPTLLAVDAKKTTVAVVVEQIGEGGSDALGGAAFGQGVRAAVAVTHGARRPRARGHRRGEAPWLRPRSPQSVT